MAKKRKKSSIATSTIIFTAIKASAMAYVVTAIFIILGSVLLTYTDLGESVEKWVILVGIMASAGLAGFDMAKIENKNGYKWGIIGGIVYLTIFILMLTFTNGLAGVGAGYLTTIALVSLVSSSFAGIVAVNQQ
ncbi:MAG: hypothetical protein ATN35_08555 [Epulopiscium sp. Nele67-Bin004]|nr:MAG: hypothetical protein ATN35_08555 [Epulopiscium sp. Nele67-Bin004]